MSAMPGFAIDSSAKGWSDSTTTALFIGTSSTVLVAPSRIFKTFGVSAGAAKMPLVAASIAAVITYRMLIVTCLSDHVGDGLISPNLERACAKACFFARIR